MRLGLLVGLLLLGCSGRLEEEEFQSAKRGLLTTLEEKGIRDPAVLRAIGKVDRHRFVHRKHLAFAYEDVPLSIGYDQALSAPHMLARMLEIVNLQPNERVLEIRTGSGYLTALLAEMSREVCTVEAVRPLGKAAARRLGELGYRSVAARVGDLYEGWPEKAPFDAIVILAAPDHVPPKLLDQLREGGRMILPLGDLSQELVLIKKDGGGIRREEYGSVRFGPMLRVQDLSPAQRGN